VQDTQRTMEANLCFKQGMTSEEQRAKIFHRKMLQGGFSPNGRKGGPSSGRYR
jgi:hypothetical protein